uniref:hypothetical protein n=1 Tax=Lacticaseibacillus paracasei TaxID=1597 RepID=UPI000A74B1D2|nr:hypothetical protein [Lacticaseibacillus paracasei]
MSLTGKSIRMVLEIKDPNIIFTQDAVIEEIRGAKALVFYAELNSNQSIALPVALPAN